MAHPVTTAELIAILAPFAGYKLRREFDTAVDIITRGAQLYDCDLRSVDADGVGVFFYNARDQYPWEKVLEVRIARRDADGERASEQVFQHVGAVREAA